MRIDDKRQFIAFQILQSQRGDILLVAIMLVAVSLLSSLTMLRYAQQMQAASKNPRVKSMMMAMEAKVRTELLKPVNYDCPSGRDSCKLGLTIEKVNSLSRALPGARCPNKTGSCGIEISVQSFEKSPITRAVVKVRYQGTELAMNDIKVVQDIPADILQPAGVYQCPDATPKFNGFRPDGTMDCLPLPSRALGNQFVDTISLTDMNAKSYHLPDEARCQPHERVDFVNWKNGGRDFTFTCAERPSPFTVFGFDPLPPPNGDVIYEINPEN